MTPKLPRSARAGGLVLVGVLALTACGSDNNTGSSSASTTTGGAGAASSAAVSGTINGEGSTAQKNALDEAISDFTGQNPGAKVNYNATGSGR
jgi:phosphate transport system substrate-binding protein